MTFSLRDIFWLMLVVGLGFGWWVERGRFVRQPIVGKAYLPDVVDALDLVSQKQSWHLQVHSISSPETSQLQIRTGPTDNSGELFVLKKVNGEWKVVKQDFWF